MDPSACFWWPILPEDLWGTLLIFDGEGGVLASPCLPFSWKYRLISCQRLLEWLIEEAGSVEVLVFIYLDDVLIVGRGRLCAHFSAVDALRTGGAVITLKSRLEAVPRLMWLGQDVDLDRGEARILRRVQCA